MTSENPMPGHAITRRRYLAGAVLSANALAGCSALDPADPPTPTATPSYEHLSGKRVHAGPNVSLALPSGVERADGPATADIVVLQGSTGVDAGTAVEWFTAGKGVALLGGGAEATLIGWIRSDPYREAFESSAYGDATPDPEFLVAFAVGSEFVSTHQYSWGDAASPTDAEILGAIEDALADRPTPQERGTEVT